MPNRDRFKCNIDGTSKGNSGISSIAYCVRNNNGDLIYAAAKVISNTSSIVAEAKAMQAGVQYCTEHNLMPVIMETDSLILKNVIDGIGKIPWMIAMEIKSIHRMTEGREITFEHVYREGNNLADCLANTVIKDAGSRVYNSTKIFHYHANRYCTWKSNRFLV